MISWPENKESYLYGEDITITVDANDLDGIVTYIEVYEGENLFFSNDTIKVNSLQKEIIP